MAEWRFYGREAELDAVGDFIRVPGFAAGLVTGGRGIGKTELMQKLRARMAGQARILIFELDDPGIENQAEANQRLFDETRPAFGEMASIRPPGQADIEIPGRPQQYFVGIIRELLAQGAVVCLDEFHMARPMGLEGKLKRLIDRSRSLSGDRPPGKLIMMGSHQQQVLEMFRGREPLHDRAVDVSKLTPWPLPTVFEMAQEQGILQFPGRMLTLWTAFGGVPGKWRNFVAAPPPVVAPGEERIPALADMGAWKSDHAWRKAFLAWERLRLQQGPRERFDNKAYVELAEVAKEALLWLALPRPKTEKFSDFPVELRRRPNRALGDALDTLRDHLGLVEYTAEFMTESYPRWRIADNSTLFQINVYPELFTQAGRQKIGERVDREPEAAALERLQDLEGHALERMAAAWLDSQPDVSLSLHAAWRQGLADIDVLAIRGRRTDPASVLVMAGCKRNARAHDTTRLDRQFDEFLGDIPGKYGKLLRDLTREKLLVSPAFDEVQRRQAERAKFQAVDIHHMAREGIEPELAPPLAG